MGQPGTRAARARGQGRLVRALRTGLGRRLGWRPVAIRGWFPGVQVVVGEGPGVPASRAAQGGGSNPARRKWVAACVASVTEGGRARLSPIKSWATRSATGGQCWRKAGKVSAQLAQYAAARCALALRRPKPPMWRGRDARSRAPGGSRVASPRRAWRHPKTASSWPRANSSVWSGLKARKRWLVRGAAQ